MFVVWHTYDDKADKYIRTNGKINFSQGGSGLDVPYVWAAYGMMPEEAYKGLNYGEDNHVHGELEAAMQGYLSAINRKPNRLLSLRGARVCRAYSTPISERSPRHSNTRARPTLPGHSHSRSASIPTITPRSLRSPTIRSTSPSCLRFPTTGSPASI